MKVSDVEAKVLVSKTCHGLSASIDPKTSSRSLPANSCRLDSIYPFKSDSFDLCVTIEDFKYPALIDTGAAVTAFNSKVWDKYLSRTDCCLDSPSSTCLTSVSGSPLVTLGKVCLNFVIDSNGFPFEAYVIEDLIHDVVLGRDFLQETVPELILYVTLLIFPATRTPSHFLVILVIIWMLELMITVYFVSGC